MTPEQILQQIFNKVFSLINSVEDTALKIKLNTEVTQIVEELSMNDIYLFIDNPENNNLETDFSKLLACYTNSEVTLNSDYR